MRLHRALSLKNVAYRDFLFAFLPFSVYTCPYMEQIVQNENETKDLGQTISTSLQDGDILCLYGDLGAGKTTFVKGLAKSLGITEEILSPTFTLMNIYNIKTSKPELRTLVHIDTYRLKTENDLKEIGAEDYLGQPGVVTIIEWPEKIMGLIENKKVIKIYFEHLSNHERKITIER